MKPIRAGVFGVRRGNDILKNLMLCNVEIVAICDSDESRLASVKEAMGGTPAVYTDFDSFIEHDMDAVVLSNHFHEHAPYAIRCLEKGIHVLSECTAAGTLAECAALVRAAEKSGAIYMLAENYPYMLFNQEMRRVFRGGSLGRLLYAEGEYNHPFDLGNAKSITGVRPYEKHWRNYMPRTYYITHSLAPLMFITGAIPKRITAMGIHAPFSEDEDCKYAPGQVGDRAAVITTQNDDGSVYRVTGCAAYGAHSNSYRVCGTRGQIENLRGMGSKVMLRYNAWQIPEGMQENNCYDPVVPDEKKEILAKAGHGGSDYYVADTFAACVREGIQPEFDVYFAVTLSAVAILAHRSILNGGIPYDVPDFRREEDRVKYENDYETPFWSHDGKAPTIPCSSHPDFVNEGEAFENYLKLVEEK